MPTASSIHNKIRVRAIPPMDQNLPLDALVLPRTKSIRSPVMAKRPPANRKSARLQLTWALNCMANKGMSKIRATRPKIAMDLLRANIRSLFKTLP